MRSRLQPPANATPSAASTRFASAPDGAVQPAQRQLGPLDQRDAMGRRQRGGGLGADQPGSDDRHPPTRPLEAGKKLLEPCRVGVLVGDPDSGDRGPGRAQAGRPHELLEGVLVDLAPRRALHAEPPAGEVEVDRPAVEMADAGRGEAVGRRQVRRRAAHERPLRERRAIAGQARADQRHRGRRSRPGGARTRSRRRRFRRPSRTAPRSRLAPLDLERRPGRQPVARRRTPGGGQPGARAIGTTPLRRRWRPTRRRRRARRADRESVPAATPWTSESAPDRVAEVVQRAPRPLAHPPRLLQPERQREREHEPQRGGADDDARPRVEPDQRREPSRGRSGRASARRCGSRPPPARATPGTGGRPCEEPAGAIRGRSARCPRRRPGCSRRRRRTRSPGRRPRGSLRHLRPCGRRPARRRRSCTIAASSSAAIRPGRSVRSFARTSAATGSSETTVACVLGPGAPVSGSIRWWAGRPSPFCHRRRPNPDVAIPCPSPTQTRAIGGASWSRGSSTATRCRPRAATRSPPASTRIERVVTPAAHERRGPARHPALCDPSQVEPRPGRDLHRPLDTVDLRAALQPARVGARLGVGLAVGQAAAVAPGDQRAADERLEDAARRPDPVDARLDQVERRRGDGHRPAGRRVHARDLAVGPKPRPAGLVALDRLRDRRGQAGVDAARVMDAPGGAGGAPFPRGGRRRCSAAAASARVRGRRGGGRSGDRRRRRCRSRHACERGRRRQLRRRPSARGACLRAASARSAGC